MSASTRHVLWIEDAAILLKRSIQSMSLVGAYLFRLDIKLIARGIDARFSGDVSLCASKKLFNGKRVFLILFVNRYLFSMLSVRRLKIY